MKQRYLPGTLISDPIESVSAKGTPCVRFTLRDEDDHGQALHCWCFSAKLWPAILTCRKGDGLSVVGRPMRRGRTGGDGPWQVADLLIQSILTIYKAPS